MKRSLYNILIALIALLYGSAAYAQINESDTVKYQLRAALTGNYQSGNVVILTLRGRLDASVMLSRAWVFKSQNSSLYQSFYHKKADNDVFSRNYLYYKPQNQVYPYAIAYLSSNYRRKVDTRSFAGAGLTAQVIRHKNSTLKLSANAIYEQSNFAASTFNDAYYNGSEQIKLWRATTFLSGTSWLCRRHLRIYYDAFWQPAFGRSSNYRTQMDVGVEFSVWKGLAFNALYSYTHENVVPLATRTSDKILSFGLSYGIRAK